MQSNTDVAIVGAGPSGSYSAMTVARTGAEVTVFEEHQEVGLPNHCAGHISISGLKNLGLHLSPKVVENEIRGVLFYSPSGRQFRIRLASPITYVINRALFDQYLAGLAEKAGAKILVGTKVKSLTSQNGVVHGITLKTGQKLNSGVIVDAEGCASHLLKQANLQAFGQSSVVVAVNCDVENVKDIETDMVEVYLTQRYAPGLFAWIIPRRDGSAKVGLATKVGNPRDCLRQFLDAHPVVKRKIRSDDVRNPSYHLIPLGGPIPRTYHGGFLAVGDAASHVKPTTGGGVIMGLTCAKIAGEIAGQAVQVNDFSERFLSRYQKMCRQTVGFDMRAMRYVRLMLNRMSDSRLDEMIGLCSRLRLGESLKSLKDIDFQGQALIPLLMNPATMLAFLYFVFASLSP